MREERFPMQIEGCLRAEEDEGLAVIRLQDNLLDVMTDLDCFPRLLQLLDAVGSSPTSHAMLFVANAKCFSPERCNHFWKQVADFGETTVGICWFIEPMKKVWVLRAENAFRQIVKKLRHIPKPVVIALQGDVAFAFLGISLACDRRVVSADTVFHNRCLEVGVPPGGALTFLLPLYVGFGRAQTILTQTSQLDAAAALELGLVDQVVPNDQLEAAATVAARDMGSLRPELVATIKRLLNLHLADLDAHFDRECEALETDARLLNRCHPLDPR